ncbi:hypothetical protein [Xenorhabdus sp. PB30.3]|uniref:hypothetical protein n=1 Tax=Xenorhabdus sp. PB30.3 TaxID=2788941 RepID=UPI001E40DE21|nr:hypothetical protein [Xenorhabdus sp. PB30.3]MCC8380340.1 hypothetical protein [Xenorhabdus sp. PB30.3]
MLHAILEGKAGRVTIGDEKPQSWRSVFKSREDLLTAAFWTRINYLSPTAMNLFFSKSLGLDITKWGNFKSFNFWPKYYFNEGEKNYAEPDVVITFERAALIVEVKPPMGGNQHITQWKKEIDAYLKSDDAKPHLYFLALGNLPKEAPKWLEKLTDDYPDIQVVTKEWKEIKHFLQTQQWAYPQDQRIIDDCLKTLTFYGIRDPLPSWTNFDNFLAKNSLNTKSIYSLFNK